jgi:hypothetical protein
MKPAVRGLLMGVNSVPHLAAAALIARGGGRVDALSWYLPYATFFCAAQAANWWWPYLVGARGRGTDKLFAHVSGAVKALPPLAGREAPSAEHTVLFPLSLAALGTGVALYLRSPAWERRLLRSNRAAAAAGGLVALACAGGVAREIAVLVKRGRGDGGVIKGASAGEAAAEGDSIAIDPLPFITAGTVAAALAWLWRVGDKW